MAELAKLLGFMSAWDRQAVLDRYEAMFDAGADAAEVMERLGSPTKVAVALAADYVSTPAPGEQTERGDPEIEIVSLEQLLAEEEQIETPAPASEPEPEPEPEPVPETPNPAPAVEQPPEKLPEETAPAASGGPLLGLYCVGAVVIGVPVTILIICVALPFLAAGAAAVAASISVVPGAVAGFNLLTDLLNDMLLISGGGLALLALGLLLACFGIWLGVTLCRLWIGGLILPLGRRVRNRKGARKE